MAATRPALLVRPCFQQDLETVQLIYAHHVLTGTGSFELEPPNLEQMTERWGHVVTHGWPWVVASPTSDLSRVIGFAYAKPYHERPAYKGTFEVSVYTAPTSLRQGAGALMVNEVLHMLKGDGAREVIALVGDSANVASINLHKKLGFTEVGTMKGVGEKFGRPLDVVILQRSLLRR